jgi:hypothetical protein
MPLWLLALGLVVATTAIAGAAVACNPEPPLPPILEGHDYDKTAREYLLRSATTVSVGRLVARVDTLIEGQGSERPEYVFQLREGWRTVLPPRLVVPGHWISCDLPLVTGRQFLFFLEGSTPLFVIPATDAAEDFAALGEFDWFYTVSGQLMRPELLQEKDSGAVDEQVDSR